MAYPDRTSGTVRLPGAAADTKFLASPVDGGKHGEDIEDYVIPVAGFATTEATGVGVVATESEAS